MTDQEHHLRTLIQTLERDNADLRAKLARLDGLTNWICSCGGTDCKGQQENAALQAAAVEVCAIARVWATVWHDKLSTDSLQRFAELEQQILKGAKP